MNQLFRVCLLTGILFLSGCGNWPNAPLKPEQGVKDYVASVSEDNATISGSVHGGSFLADYRMFIKKIDHEQVNNQDNNPLKSIPLSPQSHDITIIMRYGEGYEEKTLSLKAEPKTHYTVHFKEVFREGRPQAALDVCHRSIYCFSVWVQDSNGKKAVEDFYFVLNHSDAVGSYSQSYPILIPIIIRK